MFGLAQGMTSLPCGELPSQGYELVKGSSFANTDLGLKMVVIGKVQAEIPGGRVGSTVWLPYCDVDDYGKSIHYLIFLVKSSMVGHDDC